MCKSHCTKHLAVLPLCARFNGVLSLLYMNPTHIATTTESHPSCYLLEYHLCTDYTRSNFRAGLQLAYMSSTPPQNGCVTMTPCSLTACKMPSMGQTPRCAHIMQSRLGHAHLHNPDMAQAVLCANSSIIITRGLIIDRVVCIQSHSSVFCVSLATLPFFIVTTIHQGAGLVNRQQVQAMQVCSLQPSRVLWFNLNVVHIRHFSSCAGV